MAQYQITVDDDILHGFFQGDEGAARLVEQVLNQILQAQVTEQLQAAPYERSEDPKDTATVSAPTPFRPELAPSH